MGRRGRIEEVSRGHGGVREIREGGRFVGRSGGIRRQAGSLGGGADGDQEGLTGSGGKSGGIGVVGLVESTAG